MTAIIDMTVRSQRELDQAAQRLIEAVHDHPSTLGVITAGLQAFEEHVAREIPSERGDVASAASAFQTALVLELFENG